MARYFLGLAKTLNDGYQDDWPDGAADAAKMVLADVGPARATELAALFRDESTWLSKFAVGLATFAGKASSQ